MSNELEKNIKNYYGQVLKTNKDLKTTACSFNESIPLKIQTLLNSIHPEVKEKFYGCGLITPEAIEGAHILDLGSGSGRDSFVLSALAGKNGKVVGIDMTQEQINVAKKHKKYHEDLFGLEDKNLNFILGHIENLSECGLSPNTFDLIVSNCVINLVQNKKKVLQEAYDLLKIGGEFYFSDIYTNRRVPEHLTKNPLLHGECLSGALYWNDFFHMAKKVGFFDPRIVSSRPIDINNTEVKNLTDPIQFYSITYRLFKIPNLEPACEDYGQAVCYKGTIQDSPDSFNLDENHLFPRDKFKEVCGNTYLMLNQTRFREHFDFVGSWDTHHGLYEGCGPLPLEQNPQIDEMNVQGSCCS
jgi:ubiquinone/menaquinone biosynthesis C-methylase UbiE